MPRVNTSANSNDDADNSANNRENAMCYLPLTLNRY